MAFKIEIKRDDGWEDFWIHPYPKNYKEWIEEYKSLIEDLPDFKFRLIRYTHEVRLTNDL